MKKYMLMTMIISLGSLVFAACSGDSGSNQDADETVSIVCSSLIAADACKATSGKCTWCGSPGSCLLAADCGTLASSCKNASDIDDCSADPNCKWCTAGAICQPKNYVGCGT